MLKQSYRGKCTIEVLRPSETNPEKLEVISSRTAHNDIHPETMDLHKKLLNNEYNLRGSTGSYNYVGEPLVCLGLNGEKDPIVKSTLEESSNFKAFILNSRKIANFSFNTSENRMVCNVRNGDPKWNSPIFTERFIKLHDDIANPFKELPSSSGGSSNFVNMGLVLVPKKDKPLFSLYIEEEINVQMPPTTNYNEGDVISSIGIALRPGAGNFNSEEPEQEIWDKLFPITKLELEEELPIGPTDYLRISYTMGLKVDVYVDPEIFYRVIIEILSRDSTLGRKGWDLLQEGGWINLNTFIKSSNTSNTADIPLYLLFGSTMDPLSRASYRVRLPETYTFSVDQYAKRYLNEEYADISKNALDPNGICKQDALFINPLITSYYGGLSAPYLDWNITRNSLGFTIRGGQLVKFPANDEWHYPKTNVVTFTGLLSSLLWSGGYGAFSDTLLLNDSAIAKTKFNELTFDVVMDRGIHEKTGGSVKSYNPETDGDLPV